MITRIYIDDIWLCGICLWNYEYLFVGCEDKIRLINLKHENNITNLIGHNKYVHCIKSIKHPKYGECLKTIFFSYYNLERKR